jgi:uncharacterized protein
LPLRWYLISLLAPLLIFLIAVTVLYGLAPLRGLAQNWLLLFTAFLPALAIMILLNNVAEDIGWTGFVFARFQDRYGPLQAALLTTVFFWLFHVSSFYVDTRSWATTLVLGIFLLPQLASRLIAGWHYNSAGSSVLIAGLFHAMHNAIVNSTGLVAVVDLPQFEVLVIMDGIVVLAGAIIAVATRGRLGLDRPESNADLDRGDQRSDGNQGQSQEETDCPGREYRPGKEDGKVPKEDPRPSIAQPKPSASDRHRHDGESELHRAGCSEVVGQVGDHLRVAGERSPVIGVGGGQHH